MVRIMNLHAVPGLKFAAEHGVVCFSHLRWNFVFQRPQHLLSRFAKKHDVLFIEEPMFDSDEPKFVVTHTREGVKVAVPHLPPGIDPTAIDGIVGPMVSDLIKDQGIENFVAWYYTPMMLGWSEHLDPLAVVYDCMDELSAFKNAPPELHTREAELFSLADLVFTGGRSLYEVKRGMHESVYCFPSSIDVKHFSRAISAEKDPEDQAAIGNPRIGFCGVIDERTDINLLRDMAELRPEWQFIMLGPVVKIDPDDLPRQKNIHYLGAKSYDDLPDYIGRWDVAMMPFALNESTRFISPTKTPEYLAAGRPVVSTPIRDVVRPYGEAGLVRIAEGAEQFVDAIQSALDEDLEQHRQRAAEFLTTMSWDQTYEAMSELIADAVKRNADRSAKPELGTSVNAERETGNAEFVGSTPFANGLGWESPVE